METFQIPKDWDSTAVGMSDFLKTLPEDEILGLLKTTTAGLIAVEDVEGK